MAGLISIKNRRGQLLIAVVFVLVIIAILGWIAASMISMQSFSTAKNLQGIQALNVAEGGMHYTIATKLASSEDWSNNNNFGPVTLYPGTFTVNYISKATRHCTLRVTGTVNGITRTITAVIRKSGLPDAFDYSVCSFNYASQTLYIQNSATIYGDFYYDGPVVMQNSSRLLNGTMFSDSLVNQGSSSCASWEPITPVDPIVFDPTYYDNRLQELTHGASGPLNLGGSSVLNLNNQTWYYTSISISNSARVVGPGTLEATTGNFSLSNSAQIGDDVTVIVNGSSSMGNASSVGADFNLISRGSITMNNSQNVPAEAVFFSYGDITFNNSAQFWGSVLAPSGEVSSSNATVFNGLLYADTLNLQNSTRLNGSAGVGNVGYLRNSTVVTYDPARLPSVIPQGLEGAGTSASGEGITIFDWGESYN